VLFPRLESYFAALAPELLHPSRRVELIESASLLLVWVRTEDGDIAPQVLLLVALLLVMMMVVAVAEDVLEVTVVEKVGRRGWRQAQ
jgi:hypothetical protein